MKSKKINYVEFYLILLLLIYPLIFTNSYSKLVETKYITFVIIAMSMIYFYVIKKVFFYIEDNNSLKFSLKSVLQSLSLIDKLMLLYLIISVISVLFSDYKIEAFTGSCSNNMGLIYTIILVLVYFVIGRSSFNKKNLLIACSIGFILIVLFSTIQFMGYDLFGLLKTIKNNVLINYLSPLGNTNIYSSYLCLITPVFMTASVLYDNTTARWLSYLNAFVGYIGLFTANSDGGYVGFFAAFIVILFICAGRKERLIRFLYTCFWYCMASVFFVIIHKLFCNTARPLSDITRFMTYGIATKIGLILIVLLIIVVSKTNLNEKNEILLRKIIRTIISCFLIFFLITVLVLNIFYDELSLGIFDQYLKFSNDWGTGRGYVWKWSLNIFENGTLPDKLFGYGTGTCGIKLLSAYGSEMKYSLGYYFTNSHNEYLEILLNVGLIGLFSYLSVIILTIVKNFKRKNSLNIIFTVGVIAYCMQSFFIVMQPVVIPLLFAFLGLSNVKDITDSN